jgi:hypothetical protein
MKFQRAAEFIRVPSDLTIYCYSIQIHVQMSIVSIAFMALLRSNWKYARGIGGKRLFTRERPVYYKKVPAELCRISSGQWMRLTEWNWPECQDGGSRVQAPGLLHCMSWEKTILFWPKTLYLLIDGLATNGPQTDFSMKVPPSSPLPSPYTRSKIWKWPPK